MKRPLFRACLLVVALVMSLTATVPAGADTRPPPSNPAPPREKRAVAEPPAEADDGGAVRGVVPTRFLDTRSGLGRPGNAPVGNGQTIDLQISGVGPVPASGVSAVLLNLTATAPTSATFVTAWPAGETRPLVSNLNLQPGQTAPNLVTVGLGAGGRISLFNNQGSTHLIADVLGYVVPPDQPGGKLVDLAPTRLLDTRTGTGQPVGPGGTITLDVTGVGDLPATGVAAVVLNVTATEPTANSYVTVFPTGSTRPLASNLNVVPGDTVPNRVVVPVGADGTVSLYNNAGSTHLIADVGGYYTDNTVQEGGSGLLRMSPKRLLDTRNAGGPLGTNGTRSVQVAGVAGIPGMDVPVPPTAVVLNLTATNPSANTYLTAWPSGLPRPLASDLNVRPGETRPNLVVVKLGPTGAVDIVNNAGTVDVIVDVFAYYTGAVVTSPELNVLDAPVANAVTAVSGTTVTFAGTIAGLGLAVGQIIASGPTSGAPQGLLRRIVDLTEAGGLVTATVAAVSLDEAVPRGSYTGGIDLVPVSNNAAAKGVGATVTAPFNLALEGSGGSAGISGGLTLGAALDLKADMGFFSGVNVDFEGRLDASMSANLNVTGAYQFLSKDYELFERGFKGMVFFIGPVPVYVEPEFELGLLVEGNAEASFNATVSRSESVTIGFDMHNSDINPFVNHSGTPTTFTAQPPSAAVNVGVELQATLEAEFYGGFELGVGLAPGLSAGVNTADCTFSLDFTLAALAEFEVEIFGKEVGDGLELRTNLFSEPLAQTTFPGCAEEGWTVDTTQSPTDLANAIAGPGVTVQSATAAGSGQTGRFTAPFGSIGLDGGLILSTGNPAGIIGDNTSTNYGTSLGGPGDDALSVIAGGATGDAADLAVQFVPTTGTVEFSFVFASEEYTEYVDSQYNDVFAAFVNGTNCAVVDKGYELVPSTVNAINHLRNTLQYRDNADNTHKIQADGLTTVLRCRAAVTPGVTNTLRLAIADTGDRVYDSWAFVQRDSLRAV